MFGIIMYLLLGSGSKQYWADGMDVVAKNSADPATNDDYLDIGVSQKENSNYKFKK